MNRKWLILIALAVGVIGFAGWTYGHGMGGFGMMNPGGFLSSGYMGTMMATGMACPMMQHTSGPSLNEKEISYWTCSMHPSVHVDQPGDCPICGMKLIPVYKSEEGQIKANKETEHEFEAEIVTKDNSLLKVGDKAPLFALPDLKGDTVFFNDSTVQATVLWITNFCPGCQEKIPDMIELHNQYAKRGVMILAIGLLGRDRELPYSVAREFSTPFAVLIDTSGSVAMAYGGEYVAGSCPLQNFYLIDQTGIIRYASHYPGTSQKVMETELRKILKDTKEG